MRMLICQRKCSWQHHEALITVSKRPQKLFKDISYESPVSLPVIKWNSGEVFSALSVITSCYLLTESWIMSDLCYLDSGILGLPNRLERWSIASHRLTDGGQPSKTIRTQWLGDPKPSNAMDAPNHSIQ